MPLRVTSLTANGDTVEVGTFNVLVGPNNSGKSQTLRDIRDIIVKGTDTGLVVARGVGLELPPEAEARAGLRTLPHSSPDHARYLGVSADLQKVHEIALRDDWIGQQFAANNRSNLLRHLGPYWVAHLDAESRLRLASPVECYDLRSESPANALQAFFAAGEAAQESLRAAFREAFHMDIALDWAAMRKWYLKISRDFGEIPKERDRLNGLLADAPELAQQGDGYRSFAGVALAMLTFQDRLLLLDEPEAFLHPAQARVLGRWMASQARDTNTQVFVATHNSDFLWGLVSGDPAVRVIRLNRRGDTTKLHLVPPTTVRDLIESPLLSSQPVLDSLFQRGVAVCEGDPDRAVYQTVAHTRLQSRGGEDVLFIHANGKDAQRTPVALLKAAGTPVCAVVDFDVFNSESVLRGLIAALSDDAPDERILVLRGQLAQAIENGDGLDCHEEMKTAVAAWQAAMPSTLRDARKALSRIARSASPWAGVKAHGLDALREAERGVALELIALCQSIGIFVVPKGELESWMPIGLSKGSQWNRAALEKLHEGGCPEELERFVTLILERLQLADAPRA
jgi:hypothetical protein